MGMSHDFETAVEEGATLVRVGTAFFRRQGVCPGAVILIGQKELRRVGLLKRKGKPRTVFLIS